MNRENNTKPIKDLILNGSRLHSMAKASQAFAELDATVSNALPSMLSDNCQAQSYTDNALTLTTYSNAIATQLRYNSASIQSKLRKQPLFKNINKINIKVVTKPVEIEPVKHPLTPVSQPNCNMLKDTANNISSEDLANSLRKLADTLENYGKN